ncbi:hypothetical protein L0337_07875 [candidate division KSB1 bacterium]|nr:hypothetical protein [candidate division KSB1 bacterium]
MLDHLSFKINRWGSLGNQIFPYSFRAVGPEPALHVLMPSFFPFLFLTSPSLWTGFALFQQDKGKAGIPSPKIRQRAGVCQVIAVLRLSRR